MNEKRAEHALNAAMEKRLARVREHEAEIRRMAEERWWRRIDPLLPVTETVEDPNWPGCVL